MEDDDVEHADEFPILMNLGDGGQAHVYLGMRNHQLVALKIFEPGARANETSAKEAQILYRLTGHENFIHIVEYRPEARVKLNSRPERVKPMIVLEFAEKGDLFESISKQGRFIPTVSRFYIRQILSAIRYLATNDLAHRDLKLENILFDENWKLKIADFGLSRDARGDRNDYVLRSRVGTNGYQPPEMNTGRRTYTGINSDLFASGVILFLMYNGSLPFSSTRADDRVYNLIRNRNYERFWSLHEAQHEPNFYPIAFKRLMNSFFCADPEHRLRLQNIFENEWMNEPVASPAEVQAYMQERANLIALNNRRIQEIMDIRMSIELQLAEQTQCCEEPQMRERINPLRVEMMEENEQFQNRIEREESFYHSITEEQRLSVENKPKSEQVEKKQANGNTSNVGMQNEEESGQKKTVVVIEQELKETETKKKESLDKRHNENAYKGCTRIDFGISQKETLLSNYKTINFSCETLPVYTKNGVVYVDQNPGFIVACLRTFLAKQFQKKEVFMRDFVSKIQPQNYSLQYISTSHQIMVKLQFSMDEEEETHLILFGQLHRSEKGKVGIEWCRVDGNSFWLYGVESALNELLQGLV